MDRRLLITAFACWPPGRLLAQDERPQPHHRVSAEQLHNALSARFPMRLGMRGIVELQVSAPRLQLLPARNRLGATLAGQLRSAQLQQSQAGEMDVAFALRYEAADQTVRAHQLEILALRWAGLPQETRQALQNLLPALARDAVGEIVLHKLTPRELALPDTMGFEPEKITVVEDGLVISFGPKLRR